MRVSPSYGFRRILRVGSTFSVAVLKAILISPKGKVFTRIINFVTPTLRHPIFMYTFHIH